MDKDWKLLRQYLDQGSQAAFARLLDRHLKMIYGACRRDLGSDQAAEDATQAVLLKLVEKAATLGPHVQIAGWLFMTARLVCKNARRSELRRLRLEEEAARSMETNPTQNAAWQQIEPWINDGLSALSAGDRNVLLLRYFEGMTLSEVASAVGASESAATMRIARATQRLREYLRRRDVAVSSLALPALLTNHAAATVPASCRSAALQTLSAAHSGQALPALNPFIAKGILIVSTTKIVAGSIAALVLILALTFMVVRYAHSTSALVWQVAPASDPAAQQAQQQVKAITGQSVNAINSGDAQEFAASKDFAPNSPAYTQFVQNYTGIFSQHPHSCQFTVTSCTVKGNNCIVLGRMKLIVDGVSSEHTADRVGCATFVQRDGRWFRTSFGVRQYPPSF